MVQHRQHMKGFIQNHYNWVHDVSIKFLADTCMSVDQYLKELVKPGFKFDEVALVIFARMYHRHIFILMNGRYWTTRRDHDLSKCRFHLVFLGNLNFGVVRPKAEVGGRFCDGSRFYDMFFNGVSKFGGPLNLSTTQEIPIGSIATGTTSWDSFADWAKKHQHSITIPKMEPEDSDEESFHCDHPECVSKPRCLFALYLEEDSQGSDSGLGSNIFGSEGELPFENQTPIGSDSNWENDNDIPLSTINKINAEDTGHQCGSNENQVVDTDQSGTMNVVVDENVSDQVGTEPMDKQVQKDQIGTEPNVLLENQVGTEPTHHEVQKDQIGTEPNVLLENQVGTEPTHHEVQKDQIGTEPNMLLENQVGTEPTHLLQNADIPEQDKTVQTPLPPAEETNADIPEQENAATITPAIPNTDESNAHHDAQTPLPPAEETNAESPEQETAAKIVPTSLDTPVGTGTEDSSSSSSDSDSDSGSSHSRSSIGSKTYESGSETEPLTQDSSSENEEAVSSHTRQGRKTFS